MFAVVFEVRPDPTQMDAYLALAAHLAPILQTMPGFIEVERFRSTVQPGRLLSLSIWRDEKSLIRWRTLPEHQAVQARGRRAIFVDYRLRVTEITADTAEAAGTPPRQRLDETETGDARAMVVSDLADDAPESPEPAGEGLTEHDLYHSIYRPGHRLLLTAWTDADAAARWRPAYATRQRRLSIIRDYGKHDRREAPQLEPVSAPQ
jgi:heme-degrading monooxygenase HmoA